MSALQEQVEVVPSLAELAATINAEHALVIKSWAEGVEHAIRAGEALLSARNQLPLGDWGKWIRDNTELHRSTVQNYMRYAKYPHIARGSSSKNEAKFALRAAGLGLDRIGREWVEEARELSDEGISAQGIANIIGVSVSSVYLAFRPDLYAKALERTEKWRERKRREEKALEQKGLNAAAKRIGGGVAASWAGVQRLMADVDAVSRNGEDPEIKIAFKAAYGHLLEAHQCMSRVLK